MAAASAATPRPAEGWVVPAVLFNDESAERRWRDRIRAPRWSVPRSGRRRPDRSVYRCSLSGTTEIYCWDREEDSHRQVTARPNGTLAAALSADGRDIWWFADNDGDEFGRWMREPFELGGVGPQPAVPSLPDGYNCGLSLGVQTVVLGVGDAAGTTIWAVRPGSEAPGSEPKLIYRHSDHAVVGPLSADETLVAVSHAEHGDTRNPGLLALCVSDGTRAGARHDVGARLIPMGFAPAPGDQRLLVTHERTGRTGLLIWDLESGEETELAISLPGDLWGRWFPDGKSLLVVHEHAGRCALYRYELSSGRLTTERAAEGTIEDAAIRPDGTIEYLWSSGDVPQSVRALRADTGEQQLLPLKPMAAARSEPLEDVWVDGPGGLIHVFLARPASAPGPYPTVFRLHGGPHLADQDSFNAMRAAWLDSGFATVMINYRGSSGYGPSWRNAITGRPGVTELEDVAAVRRWAVTAGIARPGQCIVEGYSWGGQLALLSVGLYPEDWAAAIGGLPIADTVAEYEDEMPALQSMDRAIFGGTPDEVPEVYAAASPITYVESVQVPVLILAGENDPRCPIRQIENYQSKMRAMGKRLIVRRYNTGHGPQDTALVEAFVLASVSFARAALDGSLAGHR